MRKHARFLYQPVLPMGKNRTPITGCKAHWRVAEDTATEGTVLLKNDGTLPLKPGAKICLFGRGAGGFLFGGGGSGNVHTQPKISLADGLRTAAQAGQIEFFEPLVTFYTQFVETERKEKLALQPDAAYYRWLRGHDRPEPALPEELYRQAKAFGGIAIFCLPRYSSEGTDYGDRTGSKGDFYLDDVEKALLDRLCQDFQKVIVILNVCGPVSTWEYASNPKVGAVLYPMFSGGCAGQILTDILLGKRYPSGHLQDTLARDIEDYPSTAGFHADAEAVEYTEDIFVGYRYFETFAPEKVVYPFGYGLSYTDFSIEKESAALEKNTASLCVKVTNTGNFPGKEVVQAYLTAPQGKLGKPKKVLCAFQKTKELQPGQSQILKLHFDIRQFGSFDDLGKICKSAFVLEQGQYTVSIGSNVRSTQAYLTFILEQDIICRKCHSYLAPSKLRERLTADGSYEPLPASAPAPHKPVIRKLKSDNADQNLSLAKALEDDRLDDFIAGLSDRELTRMLYGHPDTNAADTNGIGLPRNHKRDPKTVPLVPTADGPAGLRVFPDSGIYPTFLPCANVVAQTWNPILSRKIGTVGAREIKENNVGIWLAPAMNIHRNPMCGRNFEYYSEDPLISGIFAAENVKGVQSQNIAATIKHFCCNNKEINRKCSDSRVSERALREIYLRGFEICVKTAKPWALMTSYNLINGVQASANWESINGILRGEWGYNGVVMTDWWAFSHIEDELNAGSDVKMPEMITEIWSQSRPSYHLSESLQNGRLSRAVAQTSAHRILSMMNKLD